MCIRHKIIISTTKSERREGRIISGRALKGLVFYYSQVIEIQLRNAVKERYKMGLLDNAIKGTVLTGLAIGIGAAVLAPVVLPVLAGVAKPLVKAVMKSGLMLYNKSKEVIAEAGEVTEDLWAEAKTEADAEMEEEGRTTTLDQIEEVKSGGQTS